MLRLIIVGLITFIAIKISTFGWRIFSNSNLDCKPKDISLIDRLKGHVYKLSYQIGVRSIFSFDNLERAADYIAGQFSAYGYDVQFQEYIVQNRRVRNIIAIKEGKRLPQEIVIVGAHYDSCFNPGADDNASGIAGLLELARLIRYKENIRTIKFIAFVNEEPPFFQTQKMGSSIYARDAKLKNEDIKAVIILEMIGYYTSRVNSQRYPPIFGCFYPNRGNFIAVVGNLNSRRLVNCITASFKKHSDFPIEQTATFDFIPAVTFSDHWSFWQEGFPAVMITDTAFLRNSNYHRDSDTWDKLNYENMACVVEGLDSVITGLVE